MPIMAPAPKQDWKDMPQIASAAQDMAIMLCTVSKRESITKR